MPDVPPGCVNKCVSKESIHSPGKAEVFIKQVKDVNSGIV